MKSYRFFMLLLVLCIVACCGCDSEKPSDRTAEEKEVSKSLIHPADTTLKTRIQTPDGYTRTKVRKNTLTAFLRNDSLKKDGSPVFLYNGSKKAFLLAQRFMPAQEFHSFFAFYHWCINITDL